VGDLQTGRDQARQPQDGALAVGHLQTGSQSVGHLQSVGMGTASHQKTHRINPRRIKRKPQKIFRKPTPNQPENPPNQPTPNQQRTPKNFRASNRKSQREKREQRKEEREKFSEEMRGEKEISEQIQLGRWGLRVKNIGFLSFTKCTVAFHF
jgi:hypothetical protein